MVILAVVVVSLPDGPQRPTPPCGDLPPCTSARLWDQQHTAGRTWCGLQDEVMNLTVASTWTPLTPNLRSLAIHSRGGNVPSCAQPYGETMS